MIYFKPVLYRDVNPDNDGCLYIKRPFMGRAARSGMCLWRGVRRVAGPFYRNYRNPGGDVREFADWPNNFEKVAP